MTSIAVVVKQITETLSDAVSQLVLLVIVLQERNAEVPPQLPPASVVVGSAADNLVKVAKAVAEDGYQDYPDIKQEIIDAADCVGAAKNELLRAVESLSTAERKQGWATLLSSCKTIASKTVLLLQIVYGAENDRLTRSLQSTSQAITSIKTEEASSDPNAFVPQLSDLATKIAQAAIYVSNKADGTESAVLKEQFTTAGNTLTQLSDDLINVANELLADPTNTTKRAKFEQVLQKAKQELAAVEDILEEDKQAYQDPLHKLTDDQEEIDPQAERVEKQIKQIKQLKQESMASNTANTEQLIQSVKSLHSEIVDSARAKAREYPDGIKKKQINDNIDKLEELLSQDIDAALVVVHEPDNAATKTQLEEITNHLEEVLSQVGGAKATMSERIEEEQEALEELADSLKARDKTATASAAKKIQKTNVRLAKQAKALAQSVQDPVRKAILQKAADELEQLLPREIAAVQAVMGQPEDKNLQEELQMINEQLLTTLEILDPMSLEGIARRLHQELNLLQHAANKGDVLQTPRVGSEVTNTSNELALNGRLQASLIEDPIKKKRVQETVDDLESLIPKAVLAAQLLSKDPQNKQLKENLEEILKSTEDVISDLCGNKAIAREQVESVEDIFLAAKGGDKDAVKAAAKKMAKSKAKVVRAARAEAQHIANKERREEVLKQLDQVEELIPQQLLLAEQLAESPSDVSLQEKLEEISDSITEVLEDALAASPQAVLARTSHLEEEVLEDILESAKIGDTASVNKIAKKIPKTNTKLVKAAKANAQSTTFPKERRPQLDASVDQLEVLIPQQLVLAAKVAENPHNNQLVDQLEELTERITEHIEILSEPDTVWATKVMVRELDNILETAAKGDSNALNQKSKSVPPTHTNIIKAARAEAHETDSPIRRKQILEALEDLEVLLPQEMSLAAHLAKNHASPEAQDQLNQVHHEIREVLEELAGPAAMLSSSITEELEILDTLCGVAKQGSPDAVKEVAKVIKKKNAILARQAKAGAKMVQTPERKQQLLAAVDELESLVEQEIVATMELAANPSNRSLQDRVDEIHEEIKEELQEILYPEAALSVSVREIENLLEQVTEVASKGERKAASDRAKDLEAQNQKLIRQAKAVHADTPIKKKSVMDAVQDLEVLVVRDSQLAQMLAANPADQKLVEELNQVNSQVREALHTLVGSEESLSSVDVAAKRVENDLNHLVESLESKDKKSTEQAVAKLQKRAAILVKKAKSEAKTCENPAQKKLMLASIEKVEQLLPQEVTAAKQSDASKAKEVQNNLKAALNDLTSNNLTWVAKEESDEIDQMSKAAKSADPKAVTQLAQTLVRTNTKLIEEARAQAAATQSPQRKQQLQEAASQLEAAIVNQIAAAVELVQQPENHDTQAKQHLLSERSKLLLQDAVHGASPSPQAQLLDLINKEKAQTQHLHDTAKKGNTPEVYNTLKNLEKLNDEIIEIALSEASLVKDASRKSRLKQAAESLEAQYKQVVADGKKAVANPADQAAHNKLKEDIAKLESTLQQLIQDTLAPETVQAQEGTYDLNKLVAGGKAHDPQTIHEAARQLTQDVPHLAQAVSKHPVQDSKHKDHIENAIANLQSQYSQTIAASVAVVKNPSEDNIRELNEEAAKTKQHINDVIHALANPTYVPVSKSGAKSHGTVGAKKTGLTRTIEDIASLHQQLVDATKELAQNPNNPAAQKKVENLINQIQQLNNQLLTSLPKLSKAEEIQLIANELKHQVSNLDQGVKKKNTATTARATSDLADLPSQLTSASQDLLSENKNVSADLITELTNEINDLTKKHVAQANEALSKPEDTTSQQAYNRTSKLLKDAVDDLKDVTQPNKHNDAFSQAVNKAKEDVKRIKTDVRQGKEAVAIANDIKSLVPNINKVIEETANQTVKDQQHADQINHAIQEISQNIAKTINAAKEVLANPADESKQDKLFSELSSIEANLANALDAVHPSAESEAQAAAKTAKADADKILEGLRAHDPLIVKAALASLKKEYKHAADAVKASPQQTTQLDDLLNQLSELEVKPLPQDKAGQLRVEGNVQAVKDALSDLVNSLPAGTPEASALLQCRKVNNLLAKVGGVNKGLNPSDLLTAAQDLSGALSSLVNDLKLTEDGKAANTNRNAAGPSDLSGLLAELEAAAKTVKPQKAVSPTELASLFATLDALAKPPPKKEEPATVANDNNEQAKPKGKMKKAKSQKELFSEKGNFSDNITAVADHIKEQAAEASSELSVGAEQDPILAAARAIGNEVENIAKASKAGQRQELLMSGRKINDSILAIEKEVRLLCQKVKDPKLQDRLIRSVQALRNFSTQLKILSAVKAAGGDKDSDDQLVSCTRGLGYMLGDLLGTITETKLKYK